MTGIRDSAAAASQGATALAIARTELRHRIGGAAPVPPPAAAWLARPGASFVTLSRDGRLRGCIGTVRAHRPLGEDLRANARAAALEDPRFPPVTAGELGEIEIEVSLLSALEPLPATADEDLTRRLRPGRVGMALEHLGRRALFLPQVWATLPEPERFVAELRRKAGVDAEVTADLIRWWTFTVQSWSESEDGRGERT